MIKFLKNFIKKKMKLYSSSYPMKIDAINHIMQEGHTSNFSIPAFKLSLNELFILFQTDKASIYQNVILQKKEYTRSLISGHNYGVFYEKFLKDKKDIIKNVIEIGGWIGSSSAAFYFYFKNATIYCLDINFKINTIFAERIKRVICDQSNELQINQFIDDKKLQNSIDVVIDDGAHTDECILTSFNTFFLHLTPGGHYFIEDVSKENTPITYNLLMKLASDKNKHLDDSISKKVLNNIDKIEIYKSETLMSNSRDTYLIMVSKKFND